MHRVKAMTMTAAKQIRAIKMNSTKNTAMVVTKSF
ncbi:Uncharacterised protein [uncultured Blautia sp.]|nr:Uncharacterised protein [uncultured Blautia sp.]